MIKKMFIDVDGTMTDGGIYYDEAGNELKKFNTKDAAGFFAAKKLGIEIIVLTGRSCAATRKRMKELKVDLVVENVKEKDIFISQYAHEYDIKKEEMAFIGDDLNDYKAMKMTGFSACPKDACDEVISISKYVSNKNGGAGVVRDVVRYLAGDKWESAIKEVYEFGI